MTPWLRKGSLKLCSFFFSPHWTLPPPPTVLLVAHCPPYLDLYLGHNLAFSLPPLSLLTPGSWCAKWKIPQERKDNSSGFSSCQLQSSSWSCRSDGVPCPCCTLWVPLQVPLCLRFIRSEKGRWQHSIEL